jgi:hypothetical protein
MGVGLLSRPTSPPAPEENRLQLRLLMDFGLAGLENSPRATMQGQRLLANPSLP